MLELICPISSQNHSTQRINIDLTGSLEKEFSFFASLENRKKITQTKSCPACKGQAVSLYAGLVFSQQKVVLLDSQISYCLDERSLYLTKDDLNIARHRLTNFSSDDWMPLSPELEMGRSTTSSIGVVELIIGDRIRPTLQISPEEEIFYSPKLNALFGKPTADLLPADILPDAVAFHSNELPKVMRLKFEPTTRCNFKCEFCYGRYIAQGDLTFEDYITILDRLPFVKALELTGEGEPLLNTHLYEMLKIANERGVWTHITTNASLLNEDRCRKLLSTGLDSLAISMESFEPEQFEKIRLGSKYDKVIEGIRNIARFRKERQKPLHLQLWVTLLKNTLHQVNDITEFAKEVGIDSLQFQSLNQMPAYSRFYPSELKENILSLSDMEQLFDAPDTSQKLRTAIGDIISWYRGKRCDIFMQSIMVNWQGMVTPCCFLKTPDFPAFGNINLDDFEDLWNREDYRFFRFALQHGVVLNSCTGCPSVAAA